MAQELARGMVDATTTMRIYDDGTFTIHKAFAKSTNPDRLIAFEHDADSMRRKSTTGRGAAAMATGGLSLFASNNRGVVYVTVTGDATGVRTYTTRNPGNTQLTSIRSLKAASERVLPPESTGSSTDVATQLQQLAELHAAGALTAEEFSVAKARLLR